MSNPFRLDAAAAAVALAVLMGPAAHADPWHKFAKQDAYWHHGSGWVFPRDVGAFKLRGSPTQIDGNDDVSGEYVMERNGARSTALVEIYYPNSAGVGAKLETARAAVLSSATRGTCESSQTEGKVSVAARPDIQGVKVLFKPRSTERCTEAALYFFQTPEWVVTVRASELAPDGSSDASLDAFVQALRWDTLGTDPFERDSAP